MLNSAKSLLAGRKTYQENKEGPGDVTQEVTSLCCSVTMVLWYLSKNSLVKMVSTVAFLPKYQSTTWESLA